MTIITVSFTLSETERCQAAERSCNPFYAIKETIEAAEIKAFIP